MKKTIITLLIFISGINTYAQKHKYNKKGKVKSVSFYNIKDKSKIPPNSRAFFQMYLGTNNHYEFKDKSGAYNRKEYKNETVQQYYKGIKVENASYSFHYRLDI